MQYPKRKHEGRSLRSSDTPHRGQQKQSQNTQKPSPNHKRHQKRQEINLRERPAKRGRVHRVDAPPRYPTQHILEGTIHVNSKGVGYVTILGLKEDVEIDPAFLGTALNNDRVQILLHSKIASARQGGEVTKILHRNKMDFVGILTREDGTYFVTPDDTRMYRNILIPKQHLNGAHAGEKVLATIKTWKDMRHDPIGEISRVIGVAGEHNTEIESIVYERGFDITFDEDVLLAAEKIPSKIDPHEITLRRDMRNTLTFTIDPKDAKDFDDALSWKKLPNGNIEVGVHIADVTHYVTPGSRLDREAAERGTSIYLVDRTIPMLPERLSNGICSLVPNEDRLTFSAIFELDKQGNIIKEWFGKTIIHSIRRFTYEEAQEVIDTGHGDHVEALDSLNRTAKKIRSERMRQGAIAFEAQEVKFELDENGRPIGVHRKLIQDSNRLIEEYMLLANKRVAQYIAENDKNANSVFVYRVHDVPVIEKMIELRDFLKTIGITLRFSKDGNVDSKEINRVLKEIEGHKEENMIQIATIRAMSKAVYTTKNIGHYGLGFDYYTHFTSPIRRYPDMMVHRLLEHYLKKKPVPKKVLEEQEHVARYASEMEVAAAEAERASIKLKQVEYWGTRIGSTWKGKISGVTEWGIYVEDTETKSEGMVSLRDIPNDFYFFEQANYRIVGKKSKRAYRLGDDINVTVHSVDEKKKQITLRIAK